MSPKFIKIFAAFVFHITLCHHVVAQPKYCSLRVNFENILINKGDVYISLFNNEKDFLKVPYLRRKFDISQLTHGVLFVGLPAGDYVVTIFQDLNQNGVLDKSVSIPVEPYGLSNNPNTYPTYANTRFTLNGNATITIGIKN